MKVLDPQVTCAVLTKANSAADLEEDLGCSIQGPAAGPVRRAHQALVKRVTQLGSVESLAQARELVRWLESSPRYQSLVKPGRKKLGRAQLREEVLYPRAAPPRVLYLRRGEQGLTLRVRDWSEVADTLAQLSLGIATRSELFSTLKDAKWLTAAPEPVVIPKPGALFVGHHTVLFQSKTTRVLVDPWFRPASPLDLPSYRPMQPHDFGAIDAVLITHSHGDHFHLGSLLRLPRDTRIFVPPVERESLFSTDCALRLRQLGFTRVEALAWNSTRTVGDVTIQSLPFYGEQPTDREGPYALFNEGSTWACRTKGFSAAFFADAGHDVRGNMKAVCKKLEPVDVLFTGIRGFKLAPLFFTHTTLNAFLVNVPLDALTEPQQLMADPAQAMEYGRLLRAKFVVPCADGGAPWYWREGMGPHYPGYPGVPAAEANHAEENPDADPFPERLLDEEGPSTPLILRPGEAMQASGKIVRFERFDWPFQA